MNPVETCAIMTSIGGSRRMRCGDGIDSRPLHRIADVIRQEQVSIRTATRRMKITESQALAEMNPACDMKLSDLYRWQAILKVPIAELLNEPNAGFSPHVQFRSCLLKMMRTVRTIQQKARSTAIQTMTTQLAEQLIQMMPELKDLHAWPAVGQRHQPRRHPRGLARTAGCADPRAVDMDHAAVGSSGHAHWPSNGCVKTQLCMRHSN